jgi:hypothetical protein
MSPARRALFDLFQEIIASPVLPITTSWTLAHLKYFDRQAYLDRILEQTSYIPEEFRLWILEWPAKLAFGGVWPGLPVTEQAGAGPPGPPLQYRIGRMANEAERLEGWNWLGCHNGQVSVLFYTDPEDPTFDPTGLGPGMLVWTTPDDDYIWLVLDSRPERRGKVYDLGSAVDVAMGLGECEDDEEYSGWVELLRRIWNEMETAASSDEPLEIRGEDDEFGYFGAVPASPWAPGENGEGLTLWPRPEPEMPEGMVS